MDGIQVQGMWFKFRVTGPNMVVPQARLVSCPPRGGPSLYDFSLKKMLLYLYFQIYLEIYIFQNALLREDVENGRVCLRLLHTTALFC